MNFFAEIWYGMVEEILSAFPDRGILSSEEHQRIEKLLFEKDKNAFAAAHILKRRILSKYADIRPEDWCFAKGPYGRPEIADTGLKDKLYFNISHRPEAVCCLVSNISECGVDIENNRRKVTLEEVAATVFAPSEQDYCFTEKVGIRKRFFQIWCLKEAYMKALGLGFNMDPASFSFSIEEKGISLDHQPDWQFQIQHIDHKFTIAAALHSSEKFKFQLRKINHGDYE